MAMAAADPAPAAAAGVSVARDTPRCNVRALAIASRSDC
jgi:hypothetical protein